MSFLFRSTPRQRDLALLALRVILGVIFIAHGQQKLFGMGFTGVQGAFGKMGAPFPEITGPLIALLEFFGGIALVVGLLTRLVTAGFVADMLGAILLVHLPKGLIGPGGYELVLSLLGASLALFLAGAGDFSLDGLIGRRRAYH